MSSMESSSGGDGELEMVHLEGWLSKATSGTSGALKRYFFVLATGETIDGSTQAEIRWYRSEAGGGVKGSVPLGRDTKIRLLEGDALLVKSDGQKIALHPVDPPGSASARTTAAQWYQVLDFAVQATKRAGVMPRRLTVDPNASFGSMKRGSSAGGAADLLKKARSGAVPSSAAPPKPGVPKAGASSSKEVLPATLAELFRRPAADKHRVKFAEIVHKAFAGENLDFLEACETYEHEWASMSLRERGDTAAKICVRFVEEGSEEQVNLSAKLRQSILSQVESALNPILLSSEERHRRSDATMIPESVTRNLPSGSVGSHASGVVAVPAPPRDAVASPAAKVRHRAASTKSSSGEIDTTQLPAATHALHGSVDHTMENLHAQLHQEGAENADVGHDAGHGHHARHTELGAELFAEASIEVHDLLNKNFFERFLKEARQERDELEASRLATGEHPGEGCFSSLWDLMKLDAYNAIVAHFGPIKTDLYRLEQFYKSRLACTSDLLQDTEHAIARCPIHVALPEQRITSKGLRTTYRCNEARKFALVKFTTEIEREVLRPLEELRAMIISTLDRIVEGQNGVVEEMDGFRRKHRSSLNRVRALQREASQLGDELRKNSSDLGRDSASFDGEAEGINDVSDGGGAGKSMPTGAASSSRRGLFGMFDRKKADANRKKIAARMKKLEVELSDAQEEATQAKADLERAFNRHGTSMVRAMDQLEVLELHRIEAQQQILANGTLAERSLLERQARALDDAQTACMHNMQSGDSALNDLKSFAHKLKRAAERAKKAREKAAR